MNNKTIIDVVLILSRYKKVYVVDNINQLNLDRKEFDILRNKPNITLICKNYTLPELAFLVKNSDFFIAHDGGAAHYFMQFNKGMIIFGSRPFRQSRPFNGAENLSYKSFHKGIVVEQYKGFFDEILLYVKNLQCRPCVNSECTYDHFKNINAQLIQKLLVKLKWI